MNRDDAALLAVMVLRVRWCARRVAPQFHADGRVVLHHAEGPTSPRPLATFETPAAAIAWLEAQHHLRTTPPCPDCT